MLYLYSKQYSYHTCRYCSCYQIKCRLVAMLRVKEENASASAASLAHYQWLQRIYNAHCFPPMHLICLPGQRISAMTMPCGDLGTLLDLVTLLGTLHPYSSCSGGASYGAGFNTSEHEALAAYFSLEMIRVLSMLISVGAIHNDIREDNWVLTTKLSAAAAVHEREPYYGPASICLIDFGISKVFTYAADEHEAMNPPQLSFETKAHSDTRLDFISTPSHQEEEHHEPRSTFHGNIIAKDLIGVASCIHSLLFSLEMKLTSETPELAARRGFVLRSPPMTELSQMLPEVQAKCGKDKRWDDRVMLVVPQVTLRR
jgi:serine/threonine protein kinase